MLGCMCSKFMSIHGLKVAPTQSYWSMYHSIIMESLDKYAGLGFGGKTLFLMILNGIEVGHFKLITIRIE